ncbi:hypothetical protein B0J11DRAFT_500477 [Dendryphion nanum]|uniref:Uncharacterized protein n=1 Tax=Dendryphion nanum TaxID=256645 RepID=A0A9P9J1S2_9PLEO|nr:hypothetical protein B0J11DRAFT_500477 [Dendryphion nanum]
MNRVPASRSRSSKASKVSKSSPGRRSSLAAEADTMNRTPTLRSKSPTPTLYRRQSFVADADTPNGIHLSRSKSPKALYRRYSPVKEAFDMLDQNAQIIKLAGAIFGSSHISPSPYDTFTIRSHPKRNWWGQKEYHPQGIALIAYTDPKNRDEWEYILKIEQKRTFQIAAEEMINELQEILGKLAAASNGRMLRNTGLSHRDIVHKYGTSNHPWPKWVLSWAPWGFGGILRWIWWFFSGVGYLVAGLYYVFLWSTTGKLHTESGGDFIVVDSSRSYRSRSYSFSN